jgi:hypothetical protein
MSYSTATPEQKAQVNNFVVQLRAASIRVWQLNNAMTALVNNWNSNILGILGSPQGIVIPDGNGLAGAVTLTDTQVTNLFGILQTNQSTLMTAGNQAIFMLATGPNNSTGI